MTLAGQRKRVVRFFTAADFRPAQVRVTPPVDPGDPKHPTLTAVLPDTAEVGGPEITVAIYGTGFVPETVVLFDGTSRPTTYHGPNELSTVLNPVTATGPAELVVAARNGRVRTKEPFTFTLTSGSIPEGTTEEILTWVNYSVYRAQQALDAELANDEPRDDLVNELRALISAAEE